MVIRRLKPGLQRLVTEFEDTLLAAVNADGHVRQPPHGLFLFLAAPILKAATGPLFTMEGVTPFARVSMPGSPGGVLVRPW